MLFLFFLVFGFIIGSIPFGFLIGKWVLRIDVRKAGSGNIGMTNVMRLGGKPLGVLTFLLDFAKGASVMLLAQSFLSEETTTWVIQWSCIGVAVICGHVFSIFLKFKGGKGISTLFGVLAVLQLPIGIVAALIWVGVFLLKRISSLSALFMLGILPFLFLVIPWIVGGTIFFSQFFIFSGLSILLIYRHRDNMIRLLKGEEKQLETAQESN